MDHKLHEDKAWTLAGAQGSMHKALTLSLKGSGHREEGPVPAGQVQSQRLGYEKSGQPRPSHIGLQPNTKLYPLLAPHPSADVPGACVPGHCLLHAPWFLSLGLPRPSHQSCCPQDSSPPGSRGGEARCAQPSVAGPVEAEPLLKACGPRLPPLPGLPQRLQLAGFLTQLWALPRRASTGPGRRTPGAWPLPTQHPALPPAEVHCQ